MDKARAAQEILSQAVKLAPFDGWNMTMLKQAAERAGYKKTDVIRVFPGGAIDAADAFIRQADHAMLDALQAYHLDTMKIRQRIALCVRLHLSLQEANREAIRKIAALHALPFYAHRGLKRLYGTVDTIWYAIGDTSTDFNFYTKRLLLAAVYSSTLLYWLDDSSPDHEASWAFLDRRIEDVMKIEKAKHQCRQWLNQPLKARR